MHPAEFRRRKKLTQEQLAEQLGVTQSLIAKLENGKCKPSAQVAQAYETASRGAVRLKDFPALSKVAA